MAYFLIIVGLTMLFIGGEILVVGAASLAHRLNISSTIVGLVVVGFGTSAPELLVSIHAALNNVPALAVGNIIGSNISNIALIIGLSSIMSPIVIANIPAIRRDNYIMLLSVFLFLIVAYLGYISRIMALLLAGVAFIYLYRVYLTEKKISANDSHIPDNQYANISIWQQAVKIILGIILLGFGAKFLVQGGIVVAQKFGLSEAIIGLTIVAIGTSLPELAAGIAASIKKQSGILLGNIIGSNIFNTLIILGFTALIKPLSIDANFWIKDIPFMCFCSVLLACFIYFRWTITRITGGILSGFYIFYILSML